jgi:hypothetical protein
MSAVQKHNDFIKDTETLFGFCLSFMNQEYQATVISSVKEYTRKWAKIFTLKEEETTDAIANKEVGKINNIYNELKNNIVISAMEESTNTSVTSADSALRELSYLICREKKEKAKLQRTHYEQGRILKKLKEFVRTKKLFKIALRGLMSVQHAYKLMRFFEACEEYPRLKFTTTAFRIIINNLNELKNTNERRERFLDICTRLKILNLNVNNFFISLHAIPHSRPRIGLTRATESIVNSSSRIYRTQATE